MSIQRKILEYVKKKRAVSVDDLLSHVRALEEQSGGAKGIAKKLTFKYSIKRAVKNLEKSGDITVHKIDGRQYVRLTSEGRQKLRLLHLSGNTNLVSTAWDGRWRIVILDVPESDKELRNALRYILKKARFACLKNSVWISPYPFEYMLENMKRDLDLESEMMVTVSDYLDPESESAFREKYWG